MPRESLFVGPIVGGKRRKFAKLTFNSNDGTVYLTLARGENLIHLDRDYFENPKAICHQKMSLHASNQSEEFNKIKFITEYGNGERSEVSSVTRALKKNNSFAYVLSCRTKILDATAYDVQGNQRFRSLGAFDPLRFTMVVHIFLAAEAVNVHDQEFSDWQINSFEFGGFRFVFAVGFFAVPSTPTQYLSGCKTEPAGLGTVQSAPSELDFDARNLRNFLKDAEILMGQEFFDVLCPYGRDLQANACPSPTHGEIEEAKWAFHFCFILLNLGVVKFQTKSCVVEKFESVSRDLQNPVVLAFLDGVPFVSLAIANRSKPAGF